MKRLLFVAGCLGLFFLAVRATAARLFFPPFYWKGF